MITGFTDADVPDQTGRTVLVTGANTGLGFEVSTVLGERGARVLMACRNRDKAEAARARILEGAPGADLVLVDLDLGDLASVRKAADVVAKEDRLDVLVNNAGLMMPPLGNTADGFEQQLGVNHLGPFALTGLLLPLLRETGQARVVNTSSNAHKMGRIHFDDLQAAQSYSSSGRYGQSKLANLLHTYELQRRLRAAGSDVIAVAAHPGGADTDLPRHMPSWAVSVVMPLARPFLNTARQGAWPTLAAATHPAVEGGQYFGPSGLGQIAGKARQVESNAASHDEEVARRLWEVSEELTGVSYGL